MALRTAASSVTTNPTGTQANNAAASSSSTLSPTRTYTLAPTGTVPAGYLQTSGSSIVNSSGDVITLHGVNLGGWLEIEDWMCGITDTTDDSGPHPYRQSFISAQDFVNIAALGFNLIRLPFSYLNLQNPDGTWRPDAYTLLDWAVSQAAANGIYIILDLHSWATQAENYTLISTNTNAGEAARQQAQTLWTNITTHYLNNPTILAFDLINEPVGSYANYLPRALYAAIRSIDPHRILLLEAFSAPPSQYDFHQVAYSFHEHKMESLDFATNKAVWAANKTTIESYLNFPAPFYMGEFMAVNETLAYLLQQMNSLGVAWTMWTWKAVDMADWAFHNYPHYPVTYRVNINTDSYESILETWQGLGSINATRNDDLVNMYSPYI
ncbi:hypothetical protein PRZ48_005835 [Zasmidium cellare]|uniref:Glycoside hydrolase family 5 domain-containing protein n=1 Tax=Zasmidium cellare TaxID=395010 RepID=A0ABR0EML6_ZASCE|nr:hypothetical protein PRZ48_005835 [Zasmidium cellare]